MRSLSLLLALLLTWLLTSCAGVGAAAGVPGRASGTKGPLEYDFQGWRTRTISPTEDRTYVWGIDGIEAEGPTGGALAQHTRGVGMTLAVGNEVFGHDALGSVVMRVPTSGAATRTAYDAWGAVRATPSTGPPLGATGDRVGFTGHSNEPTGLIYAQQRWLDPTTGRFLSLDPVQGMLDAPLTTQGFTYANTNPTRWTDPTGESVYVFAFDDRVKDSGEKENEFFAGARTAAEELEARETFDRRKDTIVFIRVTALNLLREQLEEAVKSAEAEGFGKVAEFHIFTHGGLDGPVGAQFRDDKLPTQLTLEEWAGIDFNWEADAEARFYGCHTAAFAKNFLTAQPKVASSWGQPRQAYPSTSPDSYQRIPSNDYWREQKVYWLSRYRFGQRPTEAFDSIRNGTFFPMDEFTRAEKEN